MARVDDYISIKSYPDGTVKRMALKNAVWTDRGAWPAVYWEYSVYEPGYIFSHSWIVGNDVYALYTPVLPVEPVHRFRRRLGEKTYAGDEKMSQSLSRSKSRLLELALCNEWELFVTLTLNSEWYDRYDLSAYKKSLGKFLDNYKQRVGGSIQYVLVPEFHADGAVHMHGLFRGIPDAELVRNANGYLDWPAYSTRFGFFSGGPIRDRERTAYYITKYITKDLSKLPKGSQVVMASKGLKRAEVIYKGSGGDMHRFDADYENDWVRILYEQNDSEFIEIPLEG